MSAPPTPSSAAPSPFLGQFRHELRTHLNHALGYAELLLDGAPEDGSDPIANALRAVVDAGARAVAAVDEALHPNAEDRQEGLAEVRRALDDILVQAGTVLDLEADDAAAADVFDILRIQAAARAALALVTYPGMVAHLVDPARPGAGAASAGPGDAPIAAAAGQKRVASGERGPWVDGRTILVVDDDAANREVLARRLERLGYQVTKAADGQEGLDILHRGEADLVLLDLMMPVLNGYQVLEACRADERLRDIPIIMISARDDIDDVVECISLGAEDFLPKPFDPVLLEARVGASLEKKWLRDQEHALLATVREQAHTLAEWNAGLEKRVKEQVNEIARLARLRRFLSPQVADMIVSSGEGDERVLTWHRSNIAVLFCDLRGFTAFAESAEPEEVMGLLREFHGAVGALVHDSNATVGYFSGDGLMVFFNDPIPCPDPAEQAVRLAVSMRDHMTELGAVWRRRGYDVGFGIGLSFGYATLGEIGFQGRSDYGVIGSVVNLAARLCDQAKPGQILVSAWAHRAVEDVVVAEDVGTLTLKGFFSPVPAYNVVALK